MTVFILIFVPNIVNSGDHWRPSTSSRETCFSTSLSTRGCDEENYWCSHVARSWTWSWQVNSNISCSIVVFFNEQYAYSHTYITCLNSNMVIWGYLQLVDVFSCEVSMHMKILLLHLKELYYLATMIWRFCSFCHLIF